MGRVAVVKHYDSDITLSMVKWGFLRRVVFGGTRTLKQRARALKKHLITFTPTNELAVYDGPKEAAWREKPYAVFYFADEAVANAKFDQLKEEAEREGIRVATLSIIIEAIGDNRGDNRIGFIPGPKYIEDKLKYGDTIDWEFGSMFDDDHDEGMPKD